MLVVAIIALCLCSTAFGYWTKGPELKEKAWKEKSDIMALEDPVGEMEVGEFQIGPFGPLRKLCHWRRDVVVCEFMGTGDARKMGSSTQSGPSWDSSPTLERPYPDDTIEISFWGDWRITHKNGTEIPRSHIYFHHILAYSNGEFITGCSNERTSWGVDRLPFPYRQVLKPKQQVKAGGFHFNNLIYEDFAEFYVSYRMHYKKHVPDPKRPVRVVKSFYWMDNYNVPGSGGKGTLHNRTKSGHIPRDGVIVSMNGHMHQGGAYLQATIEESGEPLCVSRHMYADGTTPLSDGTEQSAVPCYWDCPDICPYSPHGWYAQWDTSTCYMERPMQATTKIRLDSLYDNSCKWRAVMAWWFNFAWYGDTLPPKAESLDVLRK